MIEHTHEVELSGTSGPDEPTRSSRRRRRLVIAVALVVVVMVSAVVVVGFDDSDSATEPVDTWPALPPTMAPIADVDPPVSASTSIGSSAVELVLTGVATVEVTFGSVDADKRAEYAATATYLGDIEGAFEIEGVEQYDPDAPVYTTTSTGTATGTGTISVDGVGTGTVTIDESWWSDTDGHVIGEAVITSADGELTGLSGIIRWNSTNTAATVSYRAELSRPAG